jgi:MinD-like ATPase involved in chromosome partitioning or flagellar assembly/tetratricopeptide (TPR) repeat protein
MTDAPTTRGQIITFYSFKGGTGRTMALANVAWILAANGKRVLAIDWDLESPGLHHYFRPFLTDPKLRHSRGVIDIVRDFAAAVVDPNTPADNPTWYRRYADVEREAVSLTWRFPNRGSLDLLPAGAQDPAYSQRVSSFDWHNFYDRLGGHAFLRAMRESMRQQYDYILIDSRTGLSDSAGICTVYMPDAVVDCFTLNDQSIDGAASVAETIRKLRDGDPIRILPVPMRVEAAEQFKLEAGRDYARYRFTPYLTMDPEAVDAYWGDVEIPYKPFFAYEEILAVFGERSRQEYSLLSSFERLTAVLTLDEVREIPALDERERRRRLAQYERQKTLLANDVVISYASVNRAWTDWIAGELEGIGLRVTLREIDLAGGDPSAADPALESWLDPAARVLVLLSRDYVESPNAAALWRAIITKDPTGSMLVPVRLDTSRQAAPFTDRVPMIDLVNLTEDRARQALRTVFDELPSAVGGRHGANRQAPRFPAGQPPVWQVPQRNATFTGRVELLEALRDRLSVDVNAVAPQALYGLGGVGKTQIALEYAHRFAANYDVVWWISSEQPSVVRSSLAELAERLDLPIGESLSDTVRTVLDALRRGEPYQRWLLVYDNADDPADIEPYLPQGPGHVLLTSRNVAWGRRATTAEVGVFSRPESVALLRRRVPDLSADQADLLADRLGDLPLAIEQAGAWLAATVMPVETYLDLLDSQLAQVLNENPPPGYERPAAATWRLSLDRIRQQMPAAAKLLEVCAFFAAEPIPTSFFYNDRFIDVLLPLDPLANEPLEQSRLIGEIGRYALAKFDSGLSTIQLHRLVQAVIRDGLSEEDRAVNRRQVHDVLAALNPKDPDDPKRWLTYRQLHQHLGAADTLESLVPAVRQLVIDMVRYLWKAGDYQSSQELGEAALLSWRTASGEDDITTLSLRLHLSNTTRSLARYEEAYAADADVHRELVDRLGPDHPYTIMAVSSLAADLRVQGRYAEARDLDQDALDRSTRVLGEDHHRTTNAMNNLALSLGLVGEFQAAAELDEQTYQIRRRTHGDRHPLTLQYLAALGRDQRDIGQFEQARDLLANTMQIAEEVLGGTHPLTLRIARTLAVTLRKAGDLTAAHALTSETLPKYERKLGPTHLDTLACVNNLACDQSALGDNREARITAETALAGYRAKVGENHPFTLSCENNLAIFLRRLGEHHAARPLAERVVERFTATLGEDHPYTLACRINLANELYDLGDHAGALALDQDIRGRIQRALGPNHPDTLAAENNLAISLHRTGDEAQAEDLTRSVLIRSQQTLGADHPNSVAVRAGVRLNCDIDPPQT